MANESAERSSRRESVWDYPRPPRLEDCDREIRVVFAGVVIANTRRSKRVLETSHPPVYYLPPDDVAPEVLQPVSGTSYCEWKGTAQYFDVLAADLRARSAAWSYPDPTDDFAAIRDYVAFYPRLMDACFVDGERVTPQPGGFYGGWVTQDLIGPFKGEAGTMGW